ncbi:MAG: UBP-type zinc finger domain-containing protein [Chloroflexi bacterium]|nr:UBP-type zinc finger domain-containing protein [Chloroflexota bacterium]
MAFLSRPTKTKESTCTHAPQTIAAPSGAVCEECGSQFSLRLCTECGHVGCCESQAGHARQHALTHHHPVIKSLPLSDEHFTWCYECNRYV